jgi:hypothetical protein
MQVAPGSENELISQVNDPAPAPAGGQRSLVRNTLYLTLGNAATIPIAVVTNALLGRYLGPEEFGYLYLARTMCALQCSLWSGGSRAPCRHLSHATGPGQESISARAWSGAA